MRLSYIRGVLILMRYVFIILISLISFFNLQAQEVYTDFIDQKQIQSFTKVSTSLVCQCGCNFILSVCPHIECPWGIPIRRFIEQKIKEGLSEEEIIDKFQNGFGNSLYSEHHIKKMIENGNKAIVARIVEGYGAQISSESSLFIPGIFILLFIIFACLFIAFWYKRNFKSKQLKK